MLKTGLVRRFALFALCAALGTAQAAVITNGNFETGDLSGWTPFLTAGGSTGSGLPNVIVFDVDGDTINSFAAQFDVGRTSPPTPGLREGGGIFQNFNSVAGIFTASLNIASYNVGSSSNVDGGLFELILDGTVLDSVVFDAIDAKEILRDSLNYSGAIAAGSHELRIRITRTFLNSVDSTPHEFIDDVVADVTPDGVPEPGTFLAVALGLAAVGLLRGRFSGF